ncbi:MAG: ABC transporter substrate binding protein [Sedimenticola sp.]
MSHQVLRLSFLIFTLFAVFSTNADTGQSIKTRIAVISSYHQAYLWSQDTNRGVIAGLLEHGYLDDIKQGGVYSRDDQVESTRAVIKKWWMDTKRRNSQSEIKETVIRIVAELDAYRPDMILLGDDNATKYIGGHYIDSEVPVVFWGVNGNPLKYDLLDSIERPGHNVTGIYQAGYLREGIIELKKLLPEVQTMGVLADDSPTGRAKAKELMRFQRQGQLPVEIVEMVVTNSYQTWKEGALRMKDKVDAFFVLNHNTLKDEVGQPVDQLRAGNWYLQNIRKPDIGHERQFVVEGMLCAVDDSGFKQGYEAVKVAHRILEDGESPAEIRSYAPTQGPFIVNLERAEMLGILDRIQNSPQVEETIEKALALE